MTYSPSCRKEVGVLLRHSHYDEQQLSFHSVLPSFVLFFFYVEAFFCFIVGFPAVLQRLKISVLGFTRVSLRYNLMFRVWWKCFCEPVHD